MGACQFGHGVGRFVVNFIHSSSSLRKALFLFLFCKKKLYPLFGYYLLASKPQANGCAFAQLRAGNIKFIGSSDSQLISFEKHADNWPDQIDQWQSALSNLAAEFCAGYSSVEVHHKGSFGFQDHLLPLNRWPEEPQINATLNNSSAEKDPS